MIIHGLLLSANYLPVSGGRIFSFLRDITERRKTEQRLISGLATNSQKDAAMETGADAFAGKPLEIEQLISTLRDLLDSEGGPMR